MTVQLFSTDGREILFQEIANRKYRGILIPGSDISQGRTDATVITLQKFQRPLFSLSHHLFELFSKIRLSINEDPGIRFEALLAGEMVIPTEEGKKKLKAGQYQLTDIPLFNLLFKKESVCSIFVVHYSTALLEQWGITVSPSQPQKMPGIMENRIHEILHNPYTNDLRDFYYESSIRELLFFHLTEARNPLSGELLHKDMAAIFKADSLINSNLKQHYTIKELSRLSGINESKLKKGFRDLFGVGSFGRLIYHRMEQAKLLLEDTDKSIGDIARMTGYDSTAAFINAFRQKFAATPREWRNQSKETDNEEREI
jgi:AraC-like DNA-binding protein